MKNLVLSHDAVFSGAWPASAPEAKGAKKMCLAIPAQVVELRDGDNAVVDLAGVRKEISLALVENVEIGDYVIVHVGYALNKLDPEEAAKTLALFAEIGQLGDDTTVH
jgi:hydrogenase expression/formation protein HypC